jgi:hypothetical protein
MCHDDSSEYVPGFAIYDKDNQGEVQIVSNYVNDHI